ncbi:MAG: hypothetical protein K8R53_11505 [Bacteroidales bacterium]|nr:hypothetical protein [Bacteroidales bacterium]
MKKVAYLLLIGILGSFVAIGQTIDPVISFKEDPLTHNMHICSDGKYYFTVNGGKPEKGQICKFDLDGKQLSTYPVELDMRTIMYHKKDKSLYVSTYGQSIYRIVDLEAGTYQEAHSELFDNEQGTPALSPNGKMLYAMDNGTLKVYDFKTGKLLDTFYGIKTGSDFSSGGAAVAVSKKNIYTWDAEEQIFYIYTIKGDYVKKVKLSKGDYGFSLSYAKGKVFVSEDGDYSTGTWYGYKIK